MLAGKKLLITGVITRDSIAWEVARQAQEAGAEVVLTGFGRAKRLTDRAAKQLPEPPDVLELDVNKPEDLEAVADDLRRPLGPRRRRPARDRLRARRTRSAGTSSRRRPRARSPRSRRARTRSRRWPPRSPTSTRRRAASVVGMDFDAQVAWPVYDWMGVAKAALEATSRYLARDLGPRGVRVNLVSAGPLGTIAARGIPGFAQLADAWQKQAPLGLGHRRRRPRRRAPSASSSPTSRARSPARSSTSTAASTRWARRSRAWTAPPSARSRRWRRDPPDRRHRLPRHGGARAAARARRPTRSLCLVRAPDDAAAQERLDGVLATLYADPSPYRGRARALRGDLTEPHHARRTPDIDVVCHCAASITFDLPLDEARAINVDGTQRDARARPTPSARRRFVHVSTAYVAGTHDRARSREDMLGEPEFRNTYEQTKCEAERLVGARRGPRGARSPGRAS